MFVEGGGAKKKFLQKGDVLFREGDPGDAAFIVDSGQIGIYKVVEGEEIELSTLKSGELFGEMAIVDGSKRMAFAVAKEETVVVVIPASTVENRLAKVDPFLRALMKILVNNLRNVHQSYMKRARSVNDYMNAIQFHAQGFRMYLMQRQDNRLSANGLEKLDQIDALLDELRASFKNHPDPRESVLGETDLARRKSKE